MKGRQWMYITLANASFLINIRGKSICVLCHANCILDYKSSDFKLNLPFNMCNISCFSIIVLVRWFFNNLWCFWRLKLCQQYVCSETKRFFISFSNTYYIRVCPANLSNGIINYWAEIVFIIIIYTLRSHDMSNKWM